MTRILIIGLFFLFSVQVYAQKKKKKDKNVDKVPSISQSYERFSLFAHVEDGYLHQETSNVFMETFLDIKPKESKVLLPGLGDRQSCTYSLSDCNFVEYEDDLQLIILPIECGIEGEAPDKRIMRIHLIKSSRKTEYIFSLSYLEAKDLVLFHNYSDQDLGKLLTKKSIRFE